MYSNSNLFIKKKKQTNREEKQSRDRELKSEQRLRALMLCKLLNKLVSCGFLRLHRRSQHVTCDTRKSTIQKRRLVWTAVTGSQTRCVVGMWRQIVGFRVVYFSGFAGAGQRSCQVFTKIEQTGFLSNLTSHNSAWRGEKCHKVQPVYIMDGQSSVKHLHWAKVISKCTVEPCSRFYDV